MGQARRVGVRRCGQHSSRVGSTKINCSAYTLVSHRDSRQLALSGTLATAYRRLSCTLTAEPHSRRDRGPADAGLSQPISLFLDLALELVATLNESVQPFGRTDRTCAGGRDRDYRTSSLSAAGSFTHRLPIADRGAASARPTRSSPRRSRGRGPRSRAGRSALRAGSNGPYAASVRGWSRR